MSFIELDDKLIAAAELESDHVVDEADDDKRRLYPAINVRSKRLQNGSSAFVTDKSRQCTGDTSGELTRICDSTSPHDAESELVTRAYLYDSNGCCWNHPKVHDNWKVVLTSIMLTVLGAGLVVTGVLVELFRVEPEDSAVRGYVFLIAGVICLIPGLYHTVYIYCAVRGAHGFSFNNLPMMKFLVSSFFRKVSINLCGLFAGISQFWGFTIHSIISEFSPDLYRVSSFFGIAQYQHSPVVFLPFLKFEACVTCVRETWLRKSADLVQMIWRPLLRLEQVDRRDSTQLTGNELQDSSHHENSISDSEEEDGT